MPAVSARQPLLRNRPAVGHGVVAVRRPPKGALRVQAICDFVHQHITFGYENARSTKTAWDAYGERAGVCRDFAHLAITFCRCMNIPARYCTGYLGDVGVPPPYGPMDFAAWFEAYVDGQWQTFDPRNNVPRIGRILMARGRDATDVALSTAFGRNTLVGFKVWVGRNQRSAHALDCRHAHADGAACHGLSLFGTGQTRRASHDVPPAREPRSAARANQTRHPPVPHRAALAPRRVRQLHRHRHVPRPHRRAALRQHRHARAHRNRAARLRARNRGANLSVQLLGGRRARPRQGADSPLPGRRGDPVGGAFPLSHRIDRHQGAARDDDPRHQERIHLRAPARKRRAASRRHAAAALRQLP